MLWSICSIVVHDKVNISGIIFNTETKTCWLHPINDGVTVSGNSVTIEWQAIGPSPDNRADMFRCRLDRDQSSTVDCEYSNSAQNKQS